MKFKTRERGIEYERIVEEIDKNDYRLILRTFGEILALHERMEKPLPALSTVEFFRQPERTSWLVDDVGLIFSVLDKPGRANVHIIFWDQILRGRETLCRGMADYIIHRWHLNYICTQMPLGARPTYQFAKRVGFEEAWRDPDANKVHLVYTTEVVSP